MNPRTDGGFTLVELLLSVTISAIVLTGAVVSLNALAEAHGRTSRGFEQGIGVDRTLRMMVRDVRGATELKTSLRRLILIHEDGSAVVYERTPARDELHRVTGSSQAAAEATATALGIGSLGPTKLTAGGNLRDADYRPTAVLQGAERIDWTSLFLDGCGLGLKVTVDYFAAGGVETARACALMLPRVAPRAFRP